MESIQNIEELTRAELIVICRNFGIEKCIGTKKQLVDKIANRILEMEEEGEEEGEIEFDEEEEGCISDPGICDDDELCDAEENECVKDVKVYHKFELVTPSGQHIQGKQATLKKLKRTLGGTISEVVEIDPDDLLVEEDSAEEAEDAEEVEEAEDSVEEEDLSDKKRKKLRIKKRIVKDINTLEISKIVPFEMLYLDSIIEVFNDNEISETRVLKCKNITDVVGDLYAMALDDATFPPVSCKELEGYKSYKDDIVDNLMATIEGELDENIKDIQQRVKEGLESPERWSDEGMVDEDETEDLLGDEDLDLVLDVERPASERRKAPSLRREPVELEFEEPSSEVEVEEPQVPARELLPPGPLRTQLRKEKIIETLQRCLRQ